MVNFNSMIFRTITDEVTGANKSIRLFGKSVTELKGILSSVKTNGLFKTSIISDTDIQCIKDYNTLIESGTPHLEAMEQSTKGASSTTAQMIKNANGNTIALNQMTLGAKAASVAIKGLSIAGNMLAGMLISFAISKVIEGIYNLATASERAIEASENAKSAISSLYNAIKEHVNANVWDRGRVDDSLLTYSVDYNELHNMCFYALQQITKTQEEQIDSLTTEIAQQKEMITNA